MRPWLKRLRGALGVGVTWGLIWAVAGILIAGSNAFIPGRPWGVFLSVFDAPAPALAVPGFVGGVLFSMVVGVAGRRRKLEELSIGRFASWGAAGGVLLTLFPVLLTALGLAHPATGASSLGRSLLAVSGPFVLLSAASAAGSLLLARRAERSEGATPQPLSEGMGHPVLDAPGAASVASVDAKFRRAHGDAIDV